MASAVRFTLSGIRYDVPVSEARRLASLLNLAALGDPRQSAGGLAIVINAVIDGDLPPENEIALEGFEPTSFVNAVSQMIGRGEAGPELERLHDSITSQEQGARTPL